MIIGRRKVLLAALVVILGAAVFVNWYFGSAGSNVLDTDGESVSKNLGDAQYVSTASVNADSLEKSVSDYFEEAKLQRQRSRDEVLEGLKKLDTAEGTAAAAAVTENISKENNIENLIKAKGIDECIAAVTEDNVNIVVGCDELSDAVLLQIKEIANKQTAVPFQNITVIEVK